MPAARARRLLDTPHVTCAALAALALALAGCGRPVDTPAAPAGSASVGASAAAPAASGPPVSVTLVTARKRDLPVVLESTGTVAPMVTVDVRSQATSVIRQVHVKEGQFVQAGQLLFTLDDRTDEANVARLSAQLARDEAALADAQRQLARSRDLLAQNFVSQGAVDSNQTLAESQRAAVAAGRAAIDAARVALSYARIVAPSPGRVGAINVYPGSAVQANVTPLVTVTQLDPIDIAFALPQRHLADALDALKRGGAEVSATLADGMPPLKGQLNFVDNAVDAATGTVRVKARFPNPGQRLWPGAFVRAALTVRTLEGAIVVPQAAIVQTARGSVVYVVQDGRATLRPVQVLAVQGDDAAVGGLRPGERLVLDGRQNVRPGSAVVERPRESAPERSAGAGGSRAGTSAAGAASAASAGARSDAARAGASASAARP